jgi:UDP-N-acetylglucosamine pyrophosphorylase
VKREEEFSPLKNSEKISSQDNPHTCRLHLSRLHRRYIEQAGGTIIDSNSNSHTQSSDISQRNDDDTRGLSFLWFMLLSHKMM